MPRKALRPCAVPGCRALVTNGRCPRHLAQYQDRQAEARAEYDTRRPTRVVPTWQEEWRRLRGRYLQVNPICSCGQTATEVHHMVPVRQDATLALRWSNLRAMCKPCHSRLTATTDGGYGHPRRG